ncbi:MAG: antitoxin VapB family protein [Nitrososphaeraceae archaeon]
MKISYTKERKHVRQQLRQISVSETNYLNLKRKGTAGESFNDVITELLKKAAAQQKPTDIGGP